VKYTRVPPYDVKTHFDEVAKLCHSMLSNLKTVPKLTIRPKKMSNNLKLDDHRGESESKYIVPTLNKLLQNL